MTCKDCIHREVCYLRENVPSESYADKCGYSHFEKDLERPEGKWVEGKNGNLMCNRCGCEIRYSYLIGNKPDFPKYCCDCGADMRTKENLNGQYSSAYH